MHSETDQAVVILRLCCCDQSFELIESSDSYNRCKISEVRLSSSGAADVQLQFGRSLHNIKV